MSTKAMYKDEVQIYLLWFIGDTETKVLRGGFNLSSGVGVGRNRGRSRKLIIRLEGLLIVRG
jgi:hypothetical protein